jgi:ribosomal protein S18 acetylase RimI-like enzyme
MFDPNIVLAKKNDGNSIAELFIKATDSMIASGVKQWDYSYPKLHHVMADIDNGSAYIYNCEGAIAGAITLDKNQDEQYKKIHWHHFSTQVYVIHRLVVNPDYQGRGIGKALCLFAEKMAIANRCDTIRLDAYSLNAISNRLYIDLGYKRANGYCYFHNNVIPFYCYDKKLGL